MAMSLGLDPTTDIRKLLADGCAELGVARASLWGADARNNQRLLVAVGHTGQQRSPEGLEVEAGTGLVGLSARHRELVVVPDAANDPNHYSVAAQTGFLTRAIVSAPLVIGGETWGVLQILDSSPRSWQKHELTEANKIVNLLRLKILEQLIPPRDVLPTMPLAMALGNSAVSVRMVDGTVVCIDVKDSTELFQTTRSAEALSALRECMTYFEIAGSLGESCGGRLVASPGDALVVLFSGSSPHEGARQALRYIEQLRGAFEAQRRVAEPSNPQLRFHCAVASGQIEVGLMQSSSGLIHCALGAPIHQAFRMMKEPLVMSADQLLDIPGVTLI